MCGGDFTVGMEVKCLRCRKNGKPCDVLDVLLMPHANRLTRARIEVARLLALADVSNAELEDARAEVEAAAADFSYRLRFVHINRNKTTGTKRTPAKRGARAAPASSMAGVEVELQGIHRALLALVAGVTAVSFCCFSPAFRMLTDCSG